MTDFFKFPSTPHLATLAGVEVRDDKVLSAVECALFLANDLLVEEKIDGANLGISFDQDGSVSIQNRGSQIDLPGHGQWKSLQDWLNPRSDKMFDLLLDRYILFGEWCYAKHSIFYDALPDWFLGFDIFDKKHERFFSIERRNAMLKELDIHRAPALSYGQFSLVELEELMASSKYGDEPSEGVYLRLDEGDWLDQRAKLVRPQFVQSVVEHWSRAAIEPNRVVYGQS